MTADQIKRIAIAGVVLALVFCGYLFGVKTSAPKPEIIEARASEVQSDGSVVVERRPETKPAPPPHKIPAGTKEERRAHLVVKPSAPPVTDASGALACPDVAVDLSIVNGNDGRRIVASSPDGTVVSAIDIPIVPALVQETHPMAAGLSCGVVRCKETVGAWVERDLGRVRVGLEVMREERGGVQARARVGWAW